MNLELEHFTPKRSYAECLRGDAVVPRLYSPSSNKRRFSETSISKDTGSVRQSVYSKHDFLYLNMGQVTIVVTQTVILKHTAIMVMSGMCAVINNEILEPLRA